MNVFRFVLCLAGLAAYLLMKQILPSAAVSTPSSEAVGRANRLEPAAVGLAPMISRISAGSRSEVLTQAPAIVGFKKSPDE